MTKQVLHIPQHATVASTPATPDSGFGKIYIKTDGCWYGLDDAGTEYPLVSTSINTAVIELGAGTGSSVRIGNCNTANGNYSTVSGGFSNTASDNCSTVSGGYDNTASCNYSTVGGGYTNTASSRYSTIGGGRNNIASGYNSTLGGGCYNTTSGCFSTVDGGLCNTASCNYSTVGGGLSNTASSNSSTVSGGQQNTASGYWSTIAGGQQNTASSTYSIVGGGQQNAASCYWAAVSGGKCNTASNCYSTVGGGLSNAASDIFSTIGGGQNNIASCRYSTIGGGFQNTASGNYSSLGGGKLNTASGCFSAILGGYCNTMSCNTSGAFGCNITSVANNTFHVNNLSIYDTPTTASSNTAVLVRNASTGVVETRTIPTTNGLFAQTAQSTPVTGASLPATGSLIGTGVGTLTVPANGFSVGDSFSAKLCGELSSGNNQDIQITVMSGAVVLAASGTLSLGTSTNKIWELDINFTIRAIGAAGVAVISTNGILSYIKNASTSHEGLSFNVLNGSAFDTTISNTLSIDVTWTTANAANTIHSDHFVLTKTY